MTITTLGELRTRGLLDFNDGYRTKKDQLAASGFRIIRAGDINNGEVSPTGPDHVAEAYASAIGQKVLHDNDVVLTTKGTIGRTALVRDATGHEIYSPQLCFFRPDSSVLLAKYLYFWLSGPEFTYQSSFMKNSTDMAPYISLSQLSDTRITLPPLPEQQAIAEVLGALDDKIAANRKLATTADALVRALYDALPDEGGKNLVDICDNVRSQVTPEGSGVAYVGLESIPRRQMWLQQFGDSSAVNSAKNEFKAGDVLFGKLRPYFHKVTSAPLPGICSTDILVLRPRNNDLAGLVLAAATSDSVISETSAASEGTRMPRTKWGILGRCQIRWPGEECATRFSQTVVTIRDAIEASARESQTLAELRDTLLPALMDGTIRVKDAEKLTEEAV
ncbi:restriction endonuclease subunit S [Acidipropionibacterium jensenii]|uniref:restriction endonuclease subunit S n=1 Tax=Acidipropionibacterium jensenii TaxID=1749 RepID=UPI00214D0CDB